MPSQHLRGNANDTTSRTRARIASLLALIIATLSEVIGAGVNDHSTSDDALWADELDELIRYGALCVALSVSLEVAKVANVAVAVFWCAMFFVVGVDCVEK